MDVIQTNVLHDLHPPTPREFHLYYYIGERLNRVTMTLSLRFAVANATYYPRIQVLSLQETGGRRLALE